MTSPKSSLASGTVSASQAVADAADTELVDNIQARLKRRASNVIANMEQSGSPDVEPEEVQSAIEAIDAQTLGKIAQHIALGEMRSARETLTSATDLSDQEVRDIVEGIGNEFEEQIGTDDNQENLIGDISSTLKRQTSDFLAGLDAQGGPDVTQAEIRQAINQLTPETTRKAANRLATGNVQGAKDVLTSNTNLTSREVSDIVDGVNEDVSRTIQRFQNKASQTLEAATTYAQAVLWTVFVASAMGLAVSLVGGWLGTESSRRIAVEVDRDRRHIT